MGGKRKKVLATLYISGENFTQTPIPLWDLKKKSKNRRDFCSDVFEPMNQQLPTSKLLITKEK